MKKLYKDIRFTKCILALTAGWLMAGCSAEDELGNGSAAQQLSITPMVNDLQTTRVKEEENLHEKTLSSLDFKMFETTNGDCRIDRQFKSPAENQAEVLASGNWKESKNLQPGQSYAFYAAANTKQSLQGKSLNELQNATQQDADIWKPYSTDNSKKLFLMSSHGSYKITEEAEQDIPVELVRAAAKIKLNLSSSVNGYNITNVKWKFLNYNTNTSVFAGQTAKPNIESNNEDNTVDKIEANKCSVTTYSYSTTWTSQEDAPKIAVKVVFESKDNKNDTREKELTIPVRDPKGEMKLERNYIYTVNADIKRLKDSINIDYDEELGYLKWAITKWTTGEDTEVDADKANYLVVYPTTLDMKDKSLDESIQWFAAEECSTSDKNGYEINRFGEISTQEVQFGGADAKYSGETCDNKRGWIRIETGSQPSHNTVVYCKFKIGFNKNGHSKYQDVLVRKYPAVYSLNVESVKSDHTKDIKNRLYTVQVANTRNSNYSQYTFAKPKLDNNNMSQDNTVSPAFIIASTVGEGEHAKGNFYESNQAARDYCKKYTETAKTRKGEAVEMNGWRLPTQDEVKVILGLQKIDEAKNAFGKVMTGECYWTLDGNTSGYNNDKKQDGKFVRCVRDLTLDEIEKIENQDIE
jgi:hypothetical protein